ncbi:MAG: ankyrin repeat domain-containing protein [Deltaproteobacteria bacterium]|nr:ankyrin repeat domain-containing protein [Deltaproteobacteria bacterium]
MTLCTKNVALFLFLFWVIVSSSHISDAQISPSSMDELSYSGLFAAASQGEVSQIRDLVASGEKVDARDSHGRTPLHIAAFGGHHAVMKALVVSGADPNALENDRYDIVTIAAVANDIKTLELALSLGCRADNTTSPYDGTALIAAAHLGHTEVVEILIRAGAPLDHINNLGWTALIEAIVLGNGGWKHIDTVKALVEAGSDLKISDRNGQTPMELAKERGYSKIVELLLHSGNR